MVVVSTYYFRADKKGPADSGVGKGVRGRDEYILGIPMGPVGPMGFPWEWESPS